MSLWHKEAIKVNGRIKMYVEIQNDFTGVIEYDVREIHEKDGHKYIRFEGSRLLVDDDVNRMQNYLQNVGEWKKAYDATAWARR